MNDQPPRVLPFLALVALHAAATAACFAFWLLVPVMVCLILMAHENDAGGPMFFPMFVAGAVLFAAIITVVLEAATVVSDLLRRSCRVPLWLPPLVMFWLATVACWLLCRLPAHKVNPAVAPIAGAIITLAFIVH